MWRQAAVCAPGMRNLTCRLEFEPLHSSLLFSEIYTLRVGLTLASRLQQLQRAEICTGLMKITVDSVAGFHDMCHLYTLGI